jgi:predicted outer membrane repeat protein
LKRHGGQYESAVDACAAGTPGADTISFSVTGTFISSGININSPLNHITEDLTLAGPGAANLTLTDDITAPTDLRMLAVDAGITLNLQDLTVADTSGISNSGTVIVTNSTFSGNRTSFGSALGGAISGGTVVVEKSAFSGNTADFTLGSGSSGGAIYADTVTVTNSAFSSNLAGNGGAINANTVTVTNTTFTGNSGRGGTIYGNAVTVTNSTFSDNSGDSGGDLLHQRKLSHRRHFLR